MRKLIVVALLLSSFTGCGGCRNQMKHMQSNLFGLGRKVTLYDANGGVIRSWTIKAQIEDNGGTCYFLTDEGKAVTISGTFVVEEY